VTHKPIRLFPNIRSHTRPLDASISMFRPCERKSGENSTKRRGRNPGEDENKSLSAERDALRSLLSRIREFSRTRQRVSSRDFRTIPHHSALVLASLLPPCHCFKIIALTELEREREREDTALIRVSESARSFAKLIARNGELIGGTMTEQR